MDIHELREKMDTVQFTGKTPDEINRITSDIVFAESVNYDPPKGSMQLLRFLRGQLMNYQQITKYLRHRTSDPGVVLQDSPIDDKIPSKYAQLIVSIEELMELTIEVINAMDGKDNLLELTEEFADVHCTLCYIRKLFPISDDDILKIHEIKYQRLLERIKNDDVI